MGIFFKNRILVGNISLVVFVAFLFTLTLGALPGTASALPTSDPSLQVQVDLSDKAAMQSKDGSWKKDGGTANLVTNSAQDTVDLTVQVLTDGSFSNIVLNVDGIGNLDMSGVTSAVYKVYGSGYVYQFIYHWVYSSGLSVDSNYILHVYDGSTQLASITLDLEAPPPSGGGGGGTTTTTTTPTTTTTTTTTTDTTTGTATLGGTVTTTGITATLAVDSAAVSEAVTDPSVTTVSLAVPVAQDVTQATVPVSVEQLSQVFGAQKDVAVSFAGVTVNIPPAALDLSAFAGQNATVSFQINQVSESGTTPTTGSLIRIAGNVYELDIRVSVEGTDMGGIHNFSAPVQVDLPYDPAALGSASEDSLGVYCFNETTRAWDYVGGTVDTVNHTVTANLNHFSKYAVMSYQKTFTDLAGHWARADVEKMAARQVVSGITASTFGPELNVTRAEFAAFLQRSLKLAEDKGAAGKFADVKAGDWFAGSVGAAAKAGLIAGYEDGAFRPDQQVTRQEVAVMVSNALTYKGKNVTMTPAEVEAMTAKFSDAGAIGGWAKTAVAAAVKQSIVKGREANAFSPAANATRAESVVMIKNMLSSMGSL